VYDQYGEEGVKQHEAGGSPGGGGHPFGGGGFGGGGQQFHFSFSQSGGGRGLHSSTVQLNSSAFWVTGGAVRGCFGGV
jgi:DnaJ-class molecular chaperone